MQAHRVVSAHESFTPGPSCIVYHLTSLPEFDSMTGWFVAMDAL